MSTNDLKPAVSSDCETNFWVGDSYCVGNDTSTANSTSSSTGSSTSSSTDTSTYSILYQPSSSYVPATITTATSFPPSYTQAGQVSYCKLPRYIGALFSTYNNRQSLADCQCWRYLQEYTSTLLQLYDFG